MVYLRAAVMLLGISLSQALTTPQAIASSATDESTQVFNSQNSIPAHHLTQLFEKAASHWGITYVEAENYYNNGELVITQPNSEDYRLNFAGNIFEVELSELG